MGGTDVTVPTAQTPEGQVFGKTNVVPNRAVVRGGMRTISQDSNWISAREAMRDVVARNLPVTEASISFVDSYPPMAPTEGNKAT